MIVVIFFFIFDILFFSRFIKINKNCYLLWWINNVISYIVLELNIVNVCFVFVVIFVNNVNNI